MRESLGSNLSLEAKVGLICPTPTAPTNPLLASPASPPTSLLDLPALQAACPAASHPAHYYSSFRKCVQHNWNPPRLGYQSLACIYNSYCHCALHLNAFPLL